MAVLPDIFSKREGRCWVEKFSGKPVHVRYGWGGRSIIGYVANMSAPTTGEIVIGIGIALLVVAAVGIGAIVPELLRKRRTELLAPPSGDEDRGLSVGTPPDVPGVGS